MGPKVRPQNSVTTPELPCPKVSSRNCSTSSLKTVTKLLPLNFHEPSSSVVSILPVSNLLKSQWVSCPPSKKSVCSQKPPIRPTKKNSTWLTWAKTRISVKPPPNLKVSEMLTLNSTTTPVLLVTTSPTGWRRTRIH